LYIFLKTFQRVDPHYTVPGRSYHMECCCLSLTISISLHIMDRDETDGEPPSDIETVSSNSEMEVISSDSEPEIQVQ